MSWLRSRIAQRYLNKALRALDRGERFQATVYRDKAIRWRDEVR